MKNKALGRLWKSFLISLVMNYVIFTIAVGEWNVFDYPVGARVGMGVSVFLFTGFLCLISHVEGFDWF